MNSEKENFIKQLLYNKAKEDVLKELLTINDPETIYVYAYNYNWDNGFEIPKNIILNDCCDLSTALTIFYLADGFKYLQNRDEKNDNSKAWFVFITDLYNKIVENKFKRSDIKFVPPLNKVQLFKLKKDMSGKEYVFLEETGHNDLNICL
jgi:hypothetical protein